GILSKPGSGEEAALVVIGPIMIGAADRSAAAVSLRQEPCAAVAADIAEAAQGPVSAPQDKHLETGDLRGRVGAALIQSRYWPQQLPSLRKNAVSLIDKSSGRGVKGGIEIQHLEAPWCCRAESLPRRLLSSVQLPLSPSAALGVWHAFA